MRLSSIKIKNFRNFSDFSMVLGRSAVLVGENKVGKSNLLHALRLLLDPSLADTDRMLRDEDFWDGLKRPLTKNDVISISVELTDFENNKDHVTFLQSYLVSGKPMVARLTYLFRPIATLTDDPKKGSDYEHLFFGGADVKNTFDYRLLKRFPMTVLPALRDAETDLESWRRSPLRPLLEETIATIDRASLEAIAQQITTATSKVAQNKQISDLTQSINSKFQTTVGAGQALDMKLQFSPTDPDALPRALRIFIDDGKRHIGSASLGSSNLVYLTLKLLELGQLTKNKDRLYTFLAIEEPEAHLHPQLQRLVYRDVLRPRKHLAGAATAAKGIDEQQTSVIVTTHSPHIVSVSPLKSLALLREEENGSTVGYSLSNINLNEQQVRDLENYINVTRGEILFARSVILVEGDAEMFVLPWLAAKRGIHFDELGIVVCSVSGVDFIPYARLLRALNIHYAVLTDYDKIKANDGSVVSLGLSRIRQLLLEYENEEDIESLDDDELTEKGAELGFYVNSSTLEIELWQSGLHSEIAETLKEFGGPKRKLRAEEWEDDPDSLDQSQFLKDIERIGKGRFAQRLASRLTTDACPRYIIDALDYVS